MSNQDCPRQEESATGTDTWRISGPVRATMSASEVLCWQLGVDRTLLTRAAGEVYAVGAFAEHVATEHLADRAELVAGLERVLFGPTKDKIPSRGRSRFILALRLIGLHIGRWSAAAHIGGEILELAQGLEELDRGTVRFFLEPNKAGQAPVDPGDIWLVRAKLATSVDWTIQEGGARREACRKIAKHYDFLADVVAPDTSDFAKLIESWHIRFIKRQVKDELAQRFFDQRSSLFSKYAEVGMRDAAARGENRDKYAAAIAALMMDATLFAGRASDAAAAARLERRHRKRRGSKTGS